MKVEEYFKNAKYYERNRREQNIQIGDRKLLDWIQGPDILEGGCGVGWLSIEIAKKYPQYRIAGIDISPRNIYKAYTNSSYPMPIKNAHFITANVMGLPFGDEQFNTAIYYEVLEHLPEPEKAISEARRVLKPGGILIIVAPNLWHKKGDAFFKIGKLFDFSMSMFFENYLNPSFVEFDPDERCGGDRDAVYVTNPFELRNMLKMNGFEIVYSPFHKVVAVCKKRA